MASRSEVDRFRKATAALSGAAQQDFLAFFGALDLSRPERARDALLEFLPALALAYGEAAAAVAAEWFDELRAAAGIPTFRPTVAPPFEPAAVAATTSWAVGGLFDQALDTQGLLSVAIDRWVKQPSRDTVVFNAGKSNARWARVPSGATTCAFCLMLASRGFVYRSEETADGHKYHGKCDCVAVPDWSDSPQLEGYDPDRLYRVYETAAGQVGNRFDTGAILSALREQQGIN